MSDTPTLKEALATPLQWLEVEYPTLSPVLAAARAYEAGQDIRWCEEHEEAWNACSFGIRTRCRRVLMRLSPVAET